MNWIQHVFPKVHTSMAWSWKQQHSDEGLSSALSSVVDNQMMSSCLPCVCGGMGGTFV